MKEFYIIVLLVLTADAANMDSKALSATISTFAAKFCNELEKNKSVVSSPLSAEFVLALLTLGSTEPAHSELLSALGMPDDDAIRKSFVSVSSRLSQVKGVTLNVANRVYLPEGPHDLETQVKEDAVNVFDAGIERVDFKQGAAAAQLINKWVESKTNNRIKDLLSADSFDEYTRLVLVNALYFKGSWKKKFNPKVTEDRDFHANANKTIKVPMMYQEDKFSYSESQGLNAQLLQLPYEGDEASMLIVLPREVEGLADVLQKLASGHDLIKEIDTMHTTKVQVTVPKFKIETEIDLKQLLPKLGISAIFNKDNSGLTKLLKGKEKLYVSKAVQKAFIEVNEEGAEAAAATAVVNRMRRCASFTPEVVVDRPALWCLLISHHIAFVSVYHPTEPPPSPPPPALHGEL